GLLLALFDGAVVPFELADVKSGNTTFGHRTLGKPQIKVSSYEEYRRLLGENGVILDAEDRRKRILDGAAGLRIRAHKELLDTLVYLTEFPTAAAGGFDPAYLSLPEEVLVTVMEPHQNSPAVEH